MMIVPMLFLMICSFNLSDGQLCGDLGLCRSEGNIVICHQGVKSSNIFDILPENILNSYEHLLIHTQECDDFKGMVGLLSIYKINVLVPKHCADEKVIPSELPDIEDFEYDQND